MAKIKNTFLTKACAVLLSLSMLLGILPVSVFTALAYSDSDYGKVSIITAGGLVDDTNAAETKVNYASVTLDWFEQDLSVGRGKDGWWVGFKVEAPESMDDNAIFRSKKYNGSWSGNNLFSECKDEGTDYISIWSYLDPSMLNTALIANETVTSTFEFDWNADGSFEQEVTLNIDPTGAVLKKDSKVVYSATAILGAAEVITTGLGFDGSSNGNVVFAKNSSNTTLNWSSADDSTGRTAGWYAGVKMNAPADNFNLDSAAYQLKEGTNDWSATKSFKDNKTGDNYIELWSKISSEALKTGSITNQWRFDWDGDGVFEQTLVLTIDPEKIVLFDENGYQVYPDLGKVTTYTGGTVSGVTGNITVTVEETTLSWSEKDASIGRNEDAWWAGIKVTAPALSKSVLQNSVFQAKTSAASEWTSNNSFWSYKDSSDSDEEQYIGIWLPLTPSKIADAIKAGENITRQYKFDWNNDGIFEQTVTFTVVPSDKIVLTKLEQQGFAFESEAPVDQWVGSTYTNTASGGKGTGSITYSVSSGTDVAEVNSTSGQVTFKKTGTAKIKATKAADDLYAETSCEYTVSAIKYPQSEFKFETTGPVNITYSKDKEYTNTASGGSGNGDITYSIVSGDEFGTIDKNTGKISVIKAGQITVEAKKAADDNYNETTSTYVLVIEKADQSALEFTTVPTDNEIVYSTTAYEGIVEATGGNGNGKVKYSITSGSDYASITESGKITTIKAGTIKIKAEKAGDDCYNDATPVEITLTVVKAEQDTFAFTYPSPSAITYNENGNKYKNEAIGGKGTGSVTYEIVSGPDYASIDTSTGELSILKAGTVEVLATIDPDDCYNEKTIYYTITINKAEQTFSFKDGTSISKKYGIKSYINEIQYTALTEKADGIGYGTGAVKYEIAGDAIGATVDEATGEVSFADSVKKVGKVTITATKEADDCYAECVKTYDIEIKYLTAPETAYTLSGTKINDTGWYTDNVTITAPTGYKISYNNELSTSDWAASVLYTTEGATEPKISLMNESGEITDKIVVSGMKIDKTDPTDVEISYSVSLVEKVLGTVTFGIYNPKVTVTITAKNVNSTIEKFVYTLNGSDTTVLAKDFDSNEDGVAKYSFEIEPQFRNTVTATAYTVSGRSTTKADEKVIVVDTTNPKVTVDYIYGEEQPHSENNGIIYTNNSVTVKFSIDETNFDLSNEPVVTLNNLTQTVSWEFNSETDKWEGTCPVTAEQVNVIKLTFTDIAGNKLADSEGTVIEEFTKSIAIDKIAPDFNITCNSMAIVNGTYYPAIYAPVIEINESSFDPSKIELELSINDVSGTSLKTQEELDTIVQYVKNPDNWSNAGILYTLELSDLNIDATYSLKFNYTDLAGNKMTEKNVNFVFDTENPQELTVTYSEPIIEKVLETLTFGFYKAKVTVTVTAKDNFSGIDSFKWSYVKQDGVSDKNKDSFGPKTITSSNIEYSADKKTATATFDIEADARGYVVVDAYDKAGNSVNHSIPSDIIVTDNTPSEITVSYSAEGAKVRYVDAGNNDVDTFAEASEAYFDNNVKATIEIDEANFFEGTKDKSGAIIHEVGILLTKTDNNGNVSRIEYLPSGASKKYDDATSTKTVAWSDNGDKHSFVIDYTEDADYVLKVEYADFSTNEATITANDGKSATKVYESKIITVDKIKPVIAVEYSNKDVKQTIDGRDYFDDVTTATITVTEHNFRAADIEVKVIANDITKLAETETSNIDVMDYEAYLKSDASWTPNGNSYTAEITFDVDANYTFYIDYTDLAKLSPEEDYTADLFTVDTTDPTNVEISYSTSIVDVILETLTFKFYKPEVKMTISADDITSGVDYITWTYTKEEGSSSKNTASSQSAHKIDTSDLKFTNNGKTATTPEISIPANLRGHITATAFDNSGNSTVKNDSSIILIADNISPDATVTYTSDGANVRYVDSAKKDVGTFTEACGAYFDKNVKATIEIDEANFFEGKKDKSGAIIHEVGILLTKTDNNGNVSKIEYLPSGASKKYDDATSTKTVVWSDNGDKHTFAIDYTEDADYELKVEYIDFSTNEAKITSNDGKSVTKVYESKVITVDKIKPIIAVEYSNKEIKKTIDGRDYLDDVTTATITVTEHNFRASDINASVIANDVTKLNETQNSNVSVMDYKTYLKNETNWKYYDKNNVLLNPNTDAEWFNKVSKQVATITFSTDANYTFNIDYYSDLAQRKTDNCVSDKFTVDKTNPDGLKIEYTTSTERIWQKLLEAITFGYYSYKQVVEVTMTADDITAGIDHFDWVYTQEEETSTSHNVPSKTGTIKYTDSTNFEYSNNGKTATAKFTLEGTDAEQFRGSISYTVFDKSGNKTVYSDAQRINIVDTLAPEITVEYTANDCVPHFVDSSLNDVDTFAAASTAYFNKNVVAKVNINEANFFEGVTIKEEEETITVHQLGVLLTKTDDNGNVSRIEYKTTGTENYFADVDETVIIDWQDQGDNHSFTIAYDENADYVLQIEYCDRSNNFAKYKFEQSKDNGTVDESIGKYLSKVVTVDKTKPVINVEYSNKDVKKINNDRDYLVDTTTATITVTEHNFRADDIVSSIVAKNSYNGDLTGIKFKTDKGKTVAISDFANYMKSRDSWTKSETGDAYSLKVTYSDEANYTFDIAYTDLAKNKADDYATKKFTIDGTSPSAITIEYETFPGIIETILNGITFGYYQPKVDVVVTADDEIAGISYIKWSYTKEKGASSVNSDSTDFKIIKADELEYSNDGKTATVSFSIPANARGFVTAEAYDWSDNLVAKVDEELIKVVDNIAPTLKVSFNEPVQKANDISYYAGDINVTAVVNEANFYSEDVKVTVTKDGNNNPVTVTWNDNSVDEHVGTFTLHEDGDYIVTINYTDRSSNEMKTYTSNRLTLDTKTPVIEVSNIKINSANKDSKYGFTITATDTNIDYTTFKPVLIAVVRDSEGKYSTKSINLGDVKTVENGKKYSFTVDNLADDAVYSLSCGVKDMSNNEYSKILLSDGKDYANVKFSINRNGSTFYIDKNTEKLVNQYYVYSVENDVVIEEVNVDPIETYTVKLNGKALVEGTDYTSTLTNKDDEWAKRTYVIKKSLFKDEGEYSITVESTDKAETTAYSDVKNLKVSFVVDQTAPVLTISGLENGGRYQVEEQKVTIIPTDDGGRLNSLKVIVMDSEGKPKKDESGKDISVRFDMSGEELLKYLEENDGKITFTIPNGLENQVQIICNDCAVKADGSTNEYNETFTKVTVSQSGWVIFYANKPLFYGSIIAVLVVIGGLVGFIVYKKRKSAKAK